MGKIWTIYWLDGTKSNLAGQTIEAAFNLAGYGNGAIAAVDFYVEGNDSEYTYNKNTKTWEKYIDLN